MSTIGFGTTWEMLEILEHGRIPPRPSGDRVPRNEEYYWATLIYILLGLAISTMCVDLVGSQYIIKVRITHPPGLALASRNRFRSTSSGGKSRMPARHFERVNFRYSLIV